MEPKAPWTGRPEVCPAPEQSRSLKASEVRALRRPKRRLVVSYPRPCQRPPYDFNSKMRFYPRPKPPDSAPEARKPISPGLAGKAGESNQSRTGRIGIRARLPPRRRRNNSSAQGNVLGKHRTPTHAALNGQNPAHTQRPDRTVPGIVQPCVKRGLFQSCMAFGDRAIEHSSITGCGSGSTSRQSSSIAGPDKPTDLVRQRCLWRYPSRSRSVR